MPRLRGSCEYCTVLRGSCKYGTVQVCKVLVSTVLLYSCEYSTVQYFTVLRDSCEYSTFQYCKVLLSTVLYCKIPASTVQYCEVPASSARLQKQRPADNRLLGRVARGGYRVPSRVCVQQICKQSAGRHSLRISARAIGQSVAPHIGWPELNWV